MENQYREMGQFNVGEILNEPPEFTEFDDQFTVEEQYETKQLSFPKLDGVLFPIVVENSDVIAPCWWMGNAEVSLTVALNNYYQIMSEDNADSVISDVKEFLAGRVTNNTEDKREVESETQSAERASEPIKKMKVDEVLDKPYVNQSNVIKKPTVTAKKSMQKQQRVAENPSALQTTEESKPRSDVAIYETTIDVKNNKQTGGAKPITSKGFSVDLHIPTNENDVAEIDNGYKKDSLAMPDPVEIFIDHTDTLQSTFEASPEREPEEGQHVSRPDTMMSQEYTTEASMELHEAISYEDDKVERDDAIEVSERMEDILELSVLETQPEEHETQQPLEIPEQENNYQAFDELDDLTVTMDFEPAAQDISAATKVDELFTGLDESVEISEPEISEIADELTDFMTEASEKIAGLDNENIAVDELDIQEELRTLYINIFDDIAFGGKSELVDELTQLTMGLQLESKVTGRFKSDEEIDVQTLHGATHISIRKLSSVVAMIKKDLIRAITMGRFALRMQVIDVNV